MSNSSRPHGLQPTRLLRPWDFPLQSTGVGCHHLRSRFINAVTLGALFSVHRVRSSTKCVGFMILVLSVDVSHSFFLGRPTTNIHRDQGKNLNEGSLAHSSFCFSPRLCLCSSCQRALQAWVQTTLSRLHWHAPATAPLAPVGPPFGRMDLYNSSLMALEMGSGRFSREFQGLWDPDPGCGRSSLPLAPPGSLISLQGEVSATGRPEQMVLKAEGVGQAP